MPLRIGYIVGSVSARSINRRLVGAVIDLGRDQVAGGEPLEFTEIRIADLPIYNYDLDRDYPEEARALKAAIRASDGLLIATPEYNRSIPGVLKNAIDWASRPYGDSAFAGVATGIIGASVGAVGTATAQQHLRNILAYLDAPALGQPEAFIHYTKERFAADGSITDESTRQFLTDWLTAYVAWVRRFTRA